MKWSTCSAAALQTYPAIVYYYANSVQRTQNNEDTSVQDTAKFDFSVSINKNFIKLCLTKKMYCLIFFFKPQIAKVQAAFYTDLVDPRWVLRFDKTKRLLNIFVLSKHLQLLLKRITPNGSLLCDLNVTLKQLKLVHVCEGSHLFNNKFFFKVCGELLTVKPLELLPSLVPAFTPFQPIDLAVAGVSSKLAITHLSGLLNNVHHSAMLGSVFSLLNTKIC